MMQNIIKYNGTILIDVANTKAKIDFLLLFDLKNIINRGTVNIDIFPLSINMKIP
jgi:hypothetical protein